MPIKKGPFPAGLRPLKSIEAFRATARFTPAWIGTARVTQSFLEVIHSGSDNSARISQQFIEVIHSGSDNSARVSQVFLEVLHTFGTPPIIGPGNSDKAHDKSPGQGKKNNNDKAHLQFIKMRARKRDKHQGQFIGGAGAMFGPTNHVPPPLPPRPISRPETRVITRT